MASLQRWDAGLNPGLAQWVQDLALLQLWCRSQLRLDSDPSPGNSLCHKVVEKEKKKKKAMGGSVLWTGRALNLAKAHKVHSMISHHRTSSMLSCMNKGIRIRSREVIQPLSLPLSFCWAVITWRVLVISRGYTFIVTHVVTGMMAPRE